MLLTCTPVPGTTSPEPSPLVHVTAHAQPASSSTEMCVVEPSRLAMNALQEAGLGEPLEERRACARTARASIARASATASGASPPARSSSASA